ncbi:MAG TPA: cytidylate kinase-like family protein [Dehalococcoidia bacterium]|nr:cytidylate kinase-like family protein [Dehalococcoidia bacterium]
MTASVIAFSTQMGSGGNGIARAVAERLRFRFYDWEIFSRAAAEAGVSAEVLAVAISQRSPGFMERMMARLAALGAGEEPVVSSPTVPRLSTMTSDDYRQFLEHVVRELGAQGDAVIVNHNCQVLLRDLPGVLKVLVVGSDERRAARLARIQGVAPDAARKTVLDSDRQRADFLKRVYHFDWLNMANYDIALNTDRIAADLAVDIVTAAAKETP